MKQKILITLALLTLILCGYWFFMHTVRGGSISLYVVGGWNAPLSVKWNCAMRTDLAVDKKFELPLAFDEKTKDELKGFWYYSYYRGCLHEAGYDFKGNPVPSSSVNEANGQSEYTNPLVGLAFKLPERIQIASDNLLDVDLNDGLFTSSLFLDNAAVAIHAYKPDDEINTFEDLETKTERLSLTSSSVVKKSIIEGDGGLKLIKLEESDGTEGVVFMTPDKEVVHILVLDFDRSGILDSIVRTLSF